MYSEVKLNNDLTKATFGYNINDLSEGSHEKIVVECTNCKTTIHRERRNAFSKHRCPSVVGNKKRCFKCEEWKDLSLFNKNPKGSGGVGKMCRECYNSHDAVKKCEYRRSSRLKRAVKDNDIQFYINRRTLKMKSDAKKRDIPFDLTKEFLLELWNNQKGLCFYTGLEMKNSMGNKGFQCWDSPSLDRLNPSKGYTEDNVVWCIFGVNSFKQSLTLEQFKEQVSKINWNFKHEH